MCLVRFVLLRTKHQVDQVDLPDPNPEPVSLAAKVVRFFFTTRTLVVGSVVAPLMPHGMEEALRVINFLRWI